MMIFHNIIVFYIVFNKINTDLVEKKIEKSHQSQTFESNIFILFCRELYNNSNLKAAEA